MDTRFDGAFEQVEILTKKAVEARKEVDQAMTQLSRMRDGYLTLAAASDEAGNDLDHGLRNLHQLVESTAAATGGLSCGTGDCRENSRTYLESAWALHDRVQREEDSPYEHIAVDGK